MRYISKLIQVLKIQNNVRALYFRAKALKNLNRFNEAYDSVKHVTKLLNKGFNYQV